MSCSSSAPTPWATPRDARAIRKHHVTTTCTCRSPRPALTRVTALNRRFSASAPCDGTASSNRKRVSCSCGPVRFEHLTSVLPLCCQLVDPHLPLYHERRHAGAALLPETTLKPIRGHKTEACGRKLPVIWPSHGLAPLTCASQPRSGPV